MGRQYIGKCKLNLIC